MGEIQTRDIIYYSLITIGLGGLGYLTYLARNARKDIKEIIKYIRRNNKEKTDNFEISRLEKETRNPN